MQDSSDKENRPNLLSKVKLRADMFGEKALPFCFQAVASGAAFCTGLGVFQVAGLIVRVSCATPFIGPVLGAVGVGAASAFAGQISRHVHYVITTKQNPLKTPIVFTCDVDEILVDAALGLICFKLLNGRFSSVMPSNLAKPGALAYESFPGRGDSYATPNVRKELMRLFKRDGCHHCGKRWGQVIADHMPPVKESQKLAQSGSLTDSITNKLKLLSGGVIDTRLFPQCKSCSQIQAGAIRRNVKKLVLHRVGSRFCDLAGILVGLRHFSYASGVLDSRSSGEANRSLTWLPWLQLAHAADVYQAQQEDDGDSHTVDDFVVTGCNITEEIPHSSYSPTAPK